MPEFLVVDSYHGHASATAPGSGTDLASVIPPAGVYKVEVIYAISGAAEVAANALNLSLKSKSAIVTYLPTNAGVAAVYHFVVERVTADGTNPISLTTVNAATAATVYTTTLAATRLPD